MHVVFAIHSLLTEIKHVLHQKISKKNLKLKQNKCVFATKSVFYNMKFILSFSTLIFKLNIK